MGTTSRLLHLWAISVVVTFGTSELREDASLVTWAHAVNTRAKLEEALKGPVNFLEADVSLGIVKGGWMRIPIMAHPPVVESDISLEQWMEEVIANSNNSKGVKLDFKSTDVVDAALQVLKQWKENISFPLWLNADILPGPINATAVPVDQVDFFRRCRMEFPGATLSIGWTTALYSAASLRPEDMRYSWNDVWTMARAIRCAELPDSMSLTFPVRGAFVGASLPQLVWLVRNFPSSSLTVWSSIFDPFNVESLLSLRQVLPKSDVFYDLPTVQRELFIKRKVEVSYEPPEDQKWGMLRDSDEPFGCDDATIVTGGTILYGGRRTVAVFLDKPLSLPIRVTAKLRPYELSDYHGEYSEREGSVAVVASSNKTFWSESYWVNDTSPTLFAVVIGDPNHAASCCSAEISVGLDVEKENPSTDLSVASCYGHETCKLYTDRSDTISPDERSIYVGFIFRGQRALLIEDVRIEGNETTTSQGSRAILPIAGWAVLILFSLSTVSIR